MMEQIFKSVLLLSSAGAVLSSALFLLKPVTKRVFGSHWQYYIWLCVLVVMMLPVSFKIPIKTNVNIAVPQAHQAVLKNNNIGTESDAGQLPTVINKQIPVEYRNIDIAKGITLNLFDVIIYTWLLGAVIFFCGGLLSYLRFLRTIRKNSEAVSCPELETVKEKKRIKRKIHVRITQLLAAPLMVGIFKPTLLLPNIQISEKELHYILLHELTHLKRHDLWYKWFAMLVNSVHWFNPLIYLVGRQINEECEISCDLVVTKDMNEEEKNGYMSTIVSLLSANKEKGKILTTAMANNKKQIKRRFTMIRNAKSINRFMSVISIITAMLILSITVFASGAVAASLQDGLESRENNEIYVTSSMKFKVNNIQDSGWVKSISSNGSVDVKIDLAQYRTTNGYVRNCHIATLSGNLGEMKLYSNGFGFYTENELMHYMFKEDNPFFNADKIKYATFIATDSNNPSKFNRYGDLPAFSIMMDLSRDEKTIRQIAVRFKTTTDKYFYDASFPDADKYSSIDMNTTTYIGDFQDILRWFSLGEKSNYFTYFEEGNFKNKKIDGINVSIAGAAENGIDIKTDITKEGIDRVILEVKEASEGTMYIAGGGYDMPVDNSIRIVYQYRNDNGDLVDGTFEKGKNYLIDIIMFNNQNGVVYRQREYVTIP